MSTPKSQWILATRKPKSGTRVLVCVPQSYYGVYCGIWWSAADGGPGWKVDEWGYTDVTHWMPLPAHPPVRPGGHHGELG